MEIILYNGFSKRKHSTKIPSIDIDYNIVECVLKENTSSNKPTFILRDIDRSSVNYVKWGEWYYYIDDIIYGVNGLYEVQCSLDALATYRNDIIGSMQYIQYYTHNNTEISDPRLSTDTTANVTSNNTTFNHLGSGLCHMLCATGEESTDVYAVTKDAITNLLKSTVADDLEEAWDEANANILTIVDPIAHFPEVISFIAKCISQKIVTKAVYVNDAYKCINSAYTLPIPITSIGGTPDHDILLGKYPTEQKGRTGFSRLLHDSATVLIPWQATDWRRNRPYHDIYLYIPWVGTISLEPSQIIDCTTITVNATLDLYDGTCVFVINTSKGNCIGQYSTNLASKVAIGATNYSIPSITTSLVGVATSAFTGNVIGATTGALGLVNSLEAIPSSIGSFTGCAGSGVSGADRITIVSIFHDTTVDPSSVSNIIGTPHNGVMAIPNSGYVQTLNANIDCVCEGVVKNEIDSLLDGGVYIE